MGRSRVALPRDAGDEFDVYLDGVRRRARVDFEAEGRALVFERSLRRDRISRLRWCLGAWGVGTYRQDDLVDVRYAVDDDIRVGHAMSISNERDESRADR